jgi:hypothetical protein
MKATDSEIITALNNMEIYKQSLKHIDPNYQLPVSLQPDLKERWLSGE